MSERNRPTYHVEAIQILFKSGIRGVRWAVIATHPKGQGHMQQEVGSYELESYAKYMAAQLNKAAERWI